MSLTVPLITYNYARLLPTALDGLVAQRRRPDRIVVSDDASPDDPEPLLREICSRYEGVHFRRNPENLGPVPHFRARVAAVDTRYYMLQSADDVLVDPDYLADAVALLDAHPGVVAVFGHLLAIDASGQVLRPERRRSGPGWTRLGGHALRARLALDNVVPAVCTVVRTAVHEALPPFPIDNALCHDWIHWYLLTFQGDFARLERTVMHYRVHDRGLSRQGAARAWAARDLAYRQLLARPELTDDDRRQLRSGRRRARVVVHGARAWPRLLVRHPHPTTWSTVTVELLRRLRPSRRLGERLRRHQLAAHGIAPELIQ